MAKPTVLEEAAELVGGTRQQDYGSPKECHDRIAHLWSGYTNIPLTAKDVCAMMILLKVARGLNTRDSLVDIAGYALCAELVGEPTA